MFPVVLNDGKMELPKDDIYYVIAKEGVFLKKKLGVMESLAPVKEISILESITATAKMHIEKIPGQKIAKIIQFFQAIHVIHRSEAIVLLFYEEATGKYNIFPPRQKVSFGSVDYNRGISIEGQTMIGTIHSHGSMSAFHSTIDDKDEETFDGLHITIGNTDDPEVSISASIIANGYRMMVDPEEYLDKTVLTKSIDEDAQGATTTVYKWEGGKLVKDVKKTKRFGYSYRKYDKRYVVNVTEHQKRFNKKWLNVVEKGTYVHRNYGHGAYGGYGWGHNYDPTAWQGHRQVGSHRPPNKPGSNVVVLGRKQPGTIPPQNVGPQKEAGIVFPPHDQNDQDFNPCENCSWRDVKIDWAIEQYTVESDEPDEEDLINNFVPGESYVSMFGPNEEGEVTCHVCRETYNDEEKVCPTCHAAKPDMAKLSAHPLAGEDFICTVCGNTFTHRGVDICPFCDHELDFSEFLTEDQQKAVASDEVVEVHSAGNLEIGKWYICNKCTVIFETHAEECNCPECEEYMVDGYNCTPYNVEAERVARMRKDSGELAGDSESTILKDAADYDKTLERIPDPQKDMTPLSTLVQKTSRMSIKEMFKKTFGGKK